MTIQRLMMKAASDGQLTSARDYIAVDDGIWVGGTDPERQWEFEIDPDGYLRLLHLEHQLRGSRRAGTSPATPSAASA
jgi:hypothetical protein